MFHPKSRYGILQAYVDSNSCACNIESKKSGQAFGRECYSALKAKDFPVYRLGFKRGEDLLELVEEALEVLDMKLGE